MYCSKDCRDLHNDEKTVQKRIRDWDRLRTSYVYDDKEKEKRKAYYLANREKILKRVAINRTNKKQNDKKGSVTVTEKVR